MHLRSSAPASEIDKFVDEGFLEVSDERPEEATVEFRIPSITYEDRHGQITTHRIVWIHPAHNADHCHFYHEVPGDEPNFYVEVEEWDGPSEILDDLKTDDDLEAWLQELQSTGATTI